MLPADSAPAAAPISAHRGPPTRVSDFSRAASFAGFVALLALTLTDSSATRLHTWPWALVTAALWVLPIALLALRVGTRDTWRFPPPVLAAGLGVLAVGTVASAWTSPYAATSLVRIWPTLGGIALYLILHDWLTSDEGGLSRLAQHVALGGVAVVVVSLIGWLRAVAGGGWTVRNAIPFGHSNYTAGAIVLLLPWFVFQAWKGHGLPRLAWASTAALALLALAGTSSRGATLALAATAGCFAFALLLWAPWPRPRKLLLAAVVIGLGLTAVLANPRLRELALRQDWGDGARESNRQRAAMLDAGSRLGAERPLLGWGPGTVPLAYPHVRAQLDGGVENVLQLHNTPIQIWACLGATGAFALVLLALGVGRQLAGAFSARASSRPTFIAALASLGGYSLFALTDHQFDLPAIAVLAACNLAVLTSVGIMPAVSLPNPPVGTSRRARIAFAAGIAILTVAPTIALTRDLLARRAYEQGLVAWEAGHGDDFLAALDRATQLTPHDSFFQHQAASHLFRTFETTADPAEKLRLMRAAIARLDASLRTGIHQEFAHFNLGWLHLALDAHVAAARHFTAAAHLVPDKGGVYFGLSLALNAAGRRDDAVRAFALEWINDPRALTSPAWEVPALAALRPAVQAETLRLYAGLHDAPPLVRVAESWTRRWLNESWTRWFLHDFAATRKNAPAFNEEMRAFDTALPDISAGNPISSPAPWASLYTAWRAKNFRTLAPNDPALAAALTRRAMRHPDNFQSFLTAGTEDEPALLRTLRRERTGYGVLALHPDGPPLHDLYVVQENRVATDFAAALFPPKGWLPGSFLLALLPPEPMSANR